MTHPSVTFVVAARNASGTVGAAVESALSQNYAGEVKVIAVDDGSSDDTLSVLQKFKGITVLSNRTSVGRAGARNAALRLVGTELTAIQDADDISLPSRIQASVSQLQASGSLAVGTQLTWADPRKGQYAGSNWPTGRLDADALLAAGRMPIAHPSMLISTEAIRLVGGYSEKYTVAEDLDLLIRVKAIFPQAIFTSTESTEVTYFRPRTARFKYTLESMYWTSVVLADNGGASRPLRPGELYWAAARGWLRPRAKAWLGR